MHTTGSSQNKGFTLIELLVTITILAIITTFGFNAYNGAQKAARDGARKSALRELSIALQQYYTDNGTYPIAASWSGEGATYGGDSTSYIPGLAPNYIPKLPNDPHANRSYAPCNDAGITGYAYQSDGTDYKVMASCSPEGTLNADDAFYDPARPSSSWQVSTPGGRNW
jgi:prepilin-type N-terminal cleavage/methylation domain-containing protein